MNRVPKLARSRLRAVMHAFPNAVFPYEFRVAWSNVKTLSTSGLYINLRALRLNEANSSTAGPSSDAPDRLSPSRSCSRLNRRSNTPWPSGCRELPSPPPFGLM